MSESSAVADAISAVTSVSGVVEAVADAPNTVSNLFVLGTKLFYGTGYLTAFVVVFPAALCFAALPKANALMQGMLAGSAAARGRAEGMIG